MFQEDQGSCCPQREDDEGSASNSPPLAEMGWLSPLRLREDDTPAGSWKNFTLARAMESLLEQLLEFSRSYFAESRSLPVPPVAGQEVEDSNFISARSAPGAGGAGGPTMAADSLPGWDGYGARRSAWRQAHNQRAQ